MKAVVMEMPATRDPLSVRYDRTVRRVLLEAVAAREGGRAVTVFVASPGRELRSLDRGGRTAHERAFTRAAFYQVRRVPEQAGRAPDWSLKLTWGPVENRGGRYGRTVRVRLYRYSSGVRAVQAMPRSERWHDNPANRSDTGHRPDG